LSSTPELDPAARPASGRVIGMGWVALIAVYLFWGSTYPAIRIGDEAFPPLLLTGVFYVTAAAVLYPFVRGAWKATNRSDRWRYVRSSTTAGVLMLLGGNGLLSVGEVTLPAGVAALVAATLPLWLVVLDAAFLTRAVPAAMTIVGLTVGFAGIAILAAPSSVQRLDLVAIALILIGAVFWAAGSLYSKRSPHPASPFLESALQMLAGGIACLAAGVLTGEAGVPLRPTWSTLAAVAWLAIPCGVITFTAYVYALKALPTSIVATYGFVTPVVAVAGGAVLLRERLTTQTVMAMIVILLGVAIIVLARRRTVA
jgi:drug/metabolite transporter (DMT)-like permease